MEGVRGGGEDGRLRGGRVHVQGDGEGDEAAGLRGGGGGGGGGPPGVGGQDLAAGQRRARRNAHAREEQHNCGLTVNLIIVLET